MTASFSDYLTAAEIALAAIGFGAMMLNRYAVANHNDKLARITAGAATYAGDIRDELNRLPPNADYATVKARLVADATPLLEKEFADSVKAVGGTQAKLAGIISGQVGQIPPSPVISADSDAPSAIDEVLTAKALLSAVASAVAPIVVPAAPAPGNDPSPPPAATPASSLIAA